MNRLCLSKLTPLECFGNGGLVLSILLLCLQFPVSADQFIKPVFGVGIRINDEKESSRIYSNYSGPEFIGGSGPDQDAIGVDFTLYPDGTVKWVRSSRFYSGSSKRQFKAEYVALAQALVLSSPLRLKENNAPDPCTLSLFAHHVMQVTSNEAAGDCGRYYLSPNTSAQSPWLSKNLKILSAIVNKKGLEGGTSLAAVWFRLNPDGSVDVCKSVIVKPTRIAASKHVTNALCAAVRMSKLTYTTDPSDPNGPRGLLFIFDGTDQMEPLKLREVSFQDCEIVLSKEAPHKQKRATKKL